MTYFKFVLIAGLSLFLSHCGETSKPNSETSKPNSEKQKETVPEQETELSSNALARANCLTGTYKGEVDPESGFWRSFAYGDWGDNVDATISIVNNGRLEDLQVLFLIESEIGSICSSYGSLSYKEDSDNYFFRPPGKTYKFTFSSGSSFGKIGTRGSVVPVVYSRVSKKWGCRPLYRLEVSDVSYSALTLENENTSSVKVRKVGEAVFDHVKAKCEQVK